MRGQIRKSGISVIGDVPWGTHFCQFYRTKQDLVDTLVPYFKTGLENNEFCMWVTADNLKVAEAHKAMSKAVKSFSTYIKKGQIEILPYTEWYLQGGTFNSRNVLNGWIEKLNNALNKGYDGLRLTGNTFWLENKDWDNFTDYEESVNNVIGNYKIIALCTYSLDKCGAREIVDVIRNHEFAIIKEHGKWELFESSRYKNIKEELKENEKRFKLALKNAPITVAAQDRDLHFLWAYNQRTVHPEDVLGKTDFEVFPKEDANRLSSLKQRVLLTGESINEKMWITSNGKAVYLDIFLEPIKDNNGTITGVEVATVDLTKQKLMEEALQESEEKYRKLFENMSEGFAHCEMIYDEKGKASDYRFLNINPIFEQFIGLPKEKIIGKTIRAILPKVQLKAIQTFSNVVSSGEPVHFENYSRDLNKWFDVYAYKSSPGQFAYMVIDITARKQAQNALKESEERFRAISETSPIIISVTRASDGIVLYVNKSYSESLGYKQDELIGKNVLNIYYDPAERQVIMEKLNEQGFLQNYEVMIKKADGTPFWASSSVRFINFGGERAIIAATLDITGIKQAEAEKIMLNNSIQKERDRLSALVNSIPDEVWFADTNKNFTLSNPQALKEFGYNMPHPIDIEDMARSLEVLRPDGTPRPVDEAPPLRALNGEAVSNQEEIIRTPATGELRYRQVNAAPVKDTAGNIIGSVSVVRDITEQKKIQNALAENENLLRNFFDSPGVMRGIVEIVDDTTVRHIKDNDLTAGFVGLTTETLTNKLSSELGEPPEIIRLWVNHYRESQQSGKPVTFEYLDQRGDKKSWLSATVNYLHTSEFGQPRFAYIVFDITERKNAQAELAHLTTFPELNPNLILEINADAKVVYLNHAGKMLFPDLSKIGGKHPFLAGWKTLTQNLMTGKLNQSINREVRVGDFWYEQSIMYLPAFNSFRVYGRDITKRKDAEETLQRDEKRFRLMSEINGLLLSSEEPERVIQIIAKKVMAYIDCDTFFNFIVDKYKGRLKLNAYAGVPPEAAQQIEWLDFGAAICGCVARDNQPIVSVNVQENGDERASLVRSYGIKAYASYPLRIGKKTTGTISFGTKMRTSFSYDELSLIEAVADQISVALRRKEAEDQLKESEERFSKAFHSSPVALSISRISDGTFTDINKSFEQLFAYARKELVGQQATKLNIYDNPEERDEIVRLLEQRGTIVNYEVSARTKTGTAIKVLTSAEKIDINGQVHIIWTTIDITKRQQAENLLLETSNYLNNLLDYANAPIIVWDPRFRISRFNPAFERLTGYESPNIVGLDLGILFPENKKSEILQQIQRTLSGERWEVVEIPILRVDGEIRTVLWNSANVYDTDGKTIVATIAQGQDITERKQAEESLTETSDYLNNLIDFANAPIIVWDPEFRISRFNHAFERLTGISAGEAIGQQLDILFPEDSKAHSMEHIRYTVSGEHWEAVEIPIQHRDGTVRIVLWNSATLFGLDGKKVVATIAQGQDITERKQAEEEIKELNEVLRHRAVELETANKELEAFSYSVSHDLRAPLRSMQGFSQALLEDCNDILNDECKNYLKRIQSSAELMAQLIDDMLRLSRVTRADMIMSNIDLTAMAQDIAAKLKSDEPKRNITFSISPGLSTYGDEKLISIMMENLFGNAWKFTSKLAKAQIEFGVTEKDGQKTYFVRDNGVGFDMTYADKLFKPFQRLHSTGEFPGTGIGLALVQRIVQRHGGKAWAEGKVGEGATVYFTIE